MVIKIVKEAPDIELGAELCEFALETSIRLMLLETLGQIQSIST